MSFDIIILNLNGNEAESLTEVEDVLPLGDAAKVSQLFEATFPGCTRVGAQITAGGDSLEVSLAGNPVESAHLQYRFGGEEPDLFLARLSVLCATERWSAFAVSDNSNLFA